MSFFDKISGFFGGETKNECGTCQPGESAVPPVAPDEPMAPPSPMPEEKEAPVVSPETPEAPAPEGEIATPPIETPAEEEKNEL